MKKRRDRFDYWLVVWFGLLCVVAIAGEDLYAWVMGLEGLRF